jgi:hypothetical protein
METTPGAGIPRKGNSTQLDESSKGRLKQLCDKIAKEQDTGHFSALVDELNMLLESLDDSSKKDGASSRSSTYKSEDRSTPTQPDRSAS